MRLKKRIIIISIITLAILLSLFTITVHSQNESIKREITDINESIAIVTKENEVLLQEIENLRFPVGKAEDLAVVHDPQDIDKPFEVLVSATFRQETGNGTSSLWLDSNNAGGIKCFTTKDRCTSDGFQVYDSKEDGMLSLRYHIDIYVRKHGYNLQAIRAEYCACGDGTEDLERFTKVYEEEMGK